MCAVVPHHLAKGGLRRSPPVGYPGYTVRFMTRMRWHVDRNRIVATYRRCTTRHRERSCSSDTSMTKGRFRAPLDPIEQGFENPCTEAMRVSTPPLPANCCAVDSA
jgi:hypothetical protein